MTRGNILYCVLDIGRAEEGLRGASSGTNGSSWTVTSSSASIARALPLSIHRLGVAGGVSGIYTGSIQISAK